MSRPLPPANKAFIQRERLICALMAGLLPSIGLWFIPFPFPMPLGGGDGFALYLVKNTVGMVTIMTLIMTLAVRAQIAKGKVPDLDWRLTGQPGWLRFVPPWILVRAPLYGLAAMIVLAPIQVLIVRLLGVDLLERPTFILFNFVFGAAIGFIMTPLIMIAAMNDRPKAKRPVAASA